MIPDEHFPEPAVIEPRRRRGVAQPIALEAEGLGVAPVQATRDFLEGLALMPPEIEREFGAAWDRHAGAHEMFTQTILARLKVLKPEGSTVFPDRPHATLPLPTILGGGPAELGSIIDVHETSYRGPATSHSHMSFFFRQKPVTRSISHSNDLECKV